MLKELLYSQIEKGVLDPVNVLIIEDNMGDAVLLREALGETSLEIKKVDHSLTLNQAFEYLEENKPDIVFLDLSLPDASGLDSFLSLQKKIPELPIIILTGIKDTSIALDAINKGAQDFLVKGDVNENLLTKTILYSIERKRISESLRISHERYNLVSKATSDMVWDWDMVTNKIYRSKAGWDKIVGPVADEVYNHPDAWWDRIHPDDKPGNDKALTSLLHSDSDRFAIECRVQRTDGTYRYVMDRGFIIRDEKGNVIRLIGATQDVTDKKLAESELERLSLIVKETVNAIIITNVEGVIIWANESIENITGYSPGEIKNEHLLSFLEKAGGNAIFLRYMRRKLNQKQSFDSDISIVKKSGEVCWLRLQLQAQQNNLAETTGFFSIITDISKEKIAEEKLITSEKRFRSIIENSSEGITLVDALGNVSDTSPAAQKILGYTKEDYSNPTNANLVYPEDIQMVDESFKEIVSNPGLVKILEYRIKRAAGDYIWVESTFHNLLHEPAIGAVIIHFREISNRKLFEDILKTSEEKYRNLFNNNPASIFIWNPETFEIIEVNDAALQEYGYSRGEFLSLNVIDLFVSEELDSFKNLAISMMLNDDFKANIISLHKVKSGTIRHMEITYQVIDYYGKKASLCIAHNITEKIELEKKLSQERLEKQKEITAAVITAQEQEREELGRELHDNINQILATTKLYIEYALANNDMKDTLLNSAKEFIGSAVFELRRLSKSLSPPSLGEVGIAMALDELLESIQRVNKFSFHSEWTDLELVELPEQLKLTIFRIIQEQLNNIIKHADANNVWIKIKLIKNRLTVTIKDDGKGFTISKRSGGVGLKNIASRADLHNGIMKLKSEPGKGCELTILFNL